MSLPFLRGVNWVVVGGAFYEGVNQGGGGASICLYGSPHFSSMVGIFWICMFALGLLGEWRY